MMCDSLKISGSVSSVRVRWSRLRCVVVAVFLFVTALCSFGQDATILGTVTDPSGAKVAGAAVTLTDLGTGKVLHFSTNSDGDYVAPDLIIGHYTVRAEAKGFKSVERRDLELQVDGRMRVDFQMAVGAAQETVTVEGTAVAVQSDTSEISEVVSGDQLSHLGTNAQPVYLYQSDSWFLEPASRFAESDTGRRRC